MRRLDRSAVPAPPCLANYHHGTHTWDDIKADKPEIRAHLERLQGMRCAYCEGDLAVLGQHIEHFRRKGRFPELTFAWTNLYWSCDQSDSCGHHKDHGAGPYDPGDLIEPCVDDPDRFFRFRSDGTIAVRYDLSDAERRRAQETMRVFNLQPEFGRLRNMRKSAAAMYLGLVEELAALTAEERREYIQLEVRQAAGAPFSTVLRHMLEDVL